MQNNKGFSLIELAAVILIIGVSAAIAIPGYCDYTGRAKVSQALIDANAVCNKISNYAKQQKHLPN